MTKTDILTHLDRLAELTNDAGKQIIATLKAAIPEDASTKVLPAAPDRRSEERDPGEVEQRKAAELKLPVLNPLTKRNK